MPHEHPYVSQYRMAFEQASKAAALREQMRARRASEIMRAAQMQQQADQFQQRQAQLDSHFQQTAGARQQTAEAKAMEADRLNTEANRYLNMTNPPAAEAVTPPGGDPAWTRRAEGMREQYFRDHPGEQPGPAQPYSGGKSLLPHMGRYMQGGDLVAQHQEQRSADMERRTLQKDVDTLQKQLSQYLPNIENVRGVDADPKSGANKGGKKISVGTGASDVAVLDTPSFAPNAQNPIANLDQLMERYRTYGGKRDRLKQLGGAQTQPPAEPATAPKATTSKLAPGAIVRQLGKRYRIGEDGSATEIP